MAQLFRILLLFVASWFYIEAGTSWSAEPATPVYEDKSRLLVYRDAEGALQPVETPADWQRRVAHTRANMQRVMGTLPPPGALPLEVQISAETRLPRYTRRQITFAVEPKDRASAYLLIPHAAAGGDGKRIPAMLCLPESARSGKDDPAGVGEGIKYPYAHELAERGYVCLVIDYPLLHTQDYAADPYALGYASATMKGIVNHRRGLDLLESLTEVDPARLGVIGHSLGGHNALFLAVFEPRIQAVVTSCGFNVFAKHQGGDVRAWSSRYYMPRIATDFHNRPELIPFDFTEILGALAPRPVCIVAPLRDAPDFEVSGVYDCVDAAAPVYDRIFNALEHLETYYPDAGHAFPPREREAAYAFLDRHLRGLAPAPSAAATVTEWKPPRRQIVAHRGSSIDRPENTLASLRRAIDVGATATEIDLRTTRDGRIVLSHDATLHRMTDGRGPIAERTLAELSRLDAGGKFDARFRGEPIPTLEAALELCRGRIDVLLDLKENDEVYFNRVIEAVRRVGDPRRTIVGVRSVEQARLFRERLAEARQIGLIGAPDDIESYARAGVDFIRLWPRWLADATLVPRVRQAGVGLHLNGSSGSAEEVAAALKHEPESMSSDDPGRLVRTWRVLRGEPPAP